MSSRRLKISKLSWNLYKKVQKESLYQINSYSLHTKKYKKTLINCYLRKKSKRSTPVTKLKKIVTFFPTLFKNSMIFKIHMNILARNNIWRFVKRITEHFKIQMTVTFFWQLQIFLFQVINSMNGYQDIQSSNKNGFCKTKQKKNKN